MHDERRRTHILDTGDTVTVHRGKDARAETSSHLVDEDDVEFFGTLAQQFLRTGTRWDVDFATIRQERRRL